MSEDKPPLPLSTRIGYVLIGSILIGVGGTLLLWCVTWFTEGHYEYVVFNGMLGISLVIVGCDYIIDAGRR